MPSLPLSVGPVFMSAESVERISLSPHAVLNPFPSPTPYVCNICYGRSVEKRCRVSDGQRKRHHSTWGGCVHGAVRPRQDCDVSKGDDR
ncbi:hypothetical protein TorRG33x02_246130 [Trema orientale]|uniref:Uncharacterized protein n=1 Tax=Trema orientale TaxID=63057 RepID=A0A2P5DNG7_TREOI|nr:hypothetical protein TorRG33x02_246130 [Trema orientale]